MEVTMRELLKEIGSDLASQGTGPKWVSMFLITYENPSFHSEDCQSFLQKCEKNYVTLKAYPTQDYLHFMAKVKTKVLIRQSGYFSYQNCEAQIREIKNISQWEQIEYVLKGFDKKVEVRAPVVEKPTIWNMDPLAFNFTPECEQKLSERASQVLSYIGTFEDKPKTCFDVVQIMPLPTTPTGKGRRPVLVDKTGNKLQKR